ncbi:hypothetical protein F5148DRAFT_349180 [Russula earlei]|uniref:Uncharacterized protein n=1 Tax=Russula earlei TaxID=71964 RepID=A0ACC0U2V3_9AGAM|nr:hypothetical protein F5148DRAFT_349180 [Russula earlei]
MPAPPALKTSKPTSSSVHRPSPHTARTSRRRGRESGFHSDDEIQREARSDSDTDEDDQSSVDSDTDSETEPASEDVPQNGHSTLLSPSTTPPAVNGGDDHAPLLAASVNWPEMTVDDVANGTTELPVIDFADLDASVIHAKTPRAPVQRRTSASKRPALRHHSSEPLAPSTSFGPSFEPQAPSTSAGKPTPHPESMPTSSPAPHRRGQTARQAYQERLENDPSYVPTVGEFWGHDDRLLDKDLRSLSGWWRGRWQGGTRGRFFGIRGRERGHEHADPNLGDDGHSTREVPSPSRDVPPVDRPWTHDGFEELKRREDLRLQRQHQTQTSNSNGRGSRATFNPRGRSFGRGRSSPRPSVARSTDSPSSMTPRTWFLIKPERPWTKHHELFLYSDPSQRSRPGQAPTYRVKLSGTLPDAVVRTLARPSLSRALTPPRDAGQEDAELVFTVSLPRGICKPEATGSAPTLAAVSAPPSSAPTSPQQVIDHASLESMPPSSPTVAASVTRSASPSLLQVVIEEQPVATSESLADDPFKLRDPPPPTVIPLPTSTPTQINSTISPPSAPVPPTAPVPMSHSTTAPEGGLLWRSPPPHVQPTFTQPIPASAASYTSTYTYAPVSAPALPPGVALDAHGVPYELSTGRPLYLAAPPQVHTPVYMMPYTHLHSQVQHRSHASPDPSLFAPPRQSSRIEIRRPDASSVSESSRLASTHTQLHTSRPSPLRTSASAPAFIPLHAAPPAPHEFYPSPPTEVASAPPPAPAAVMGYAAYPQPPYYAFGGSEGYTYPPAQFVEYDAYNADPRVGQAVYY